MTSVLSQKKLYTFFHSGLAPYLIRGGIQYLKYWFPAFAGTTPRFLLEFTPL